MINVMVVDDQTSVLNGIARGVRFTELGVNETFFAASAQEAIGICEKTQIDIAFMDIEMPGENGLQLNKKLQEHYPDMIRILLTSHAEFTYAQESIKTGCFDYLLQPAPYEEIEECLKRSLEELYRKRKNSQLSKYGMLMQTNKTKLMDHVVLNLFSAVHEDVEESLDFLQQAGYELSEDQPIQLMIIETKLYKQTKDQLYSEKSMHKAIADALKGNGITYPVLALTTMSPFRDFVLVLFSAVKESNVISSQQYQDFYNGLNKFMPEESFSCYVSRWVPLFTIRSELERIREQYMKENISQRPGIFFEPGESGGKQNLINFSESVKRWTMLLKAGHYRMLEKEISNVILNTIENRSFKHKNLIELHQQLTRIFLEHFYNNNVDVSELFDKTYTYNDYMNSFAHSQSLLTAIKYMLNKAEQLHEKNLPKSDVERAKSYIQDNLAEQITVKEVAEHIGFSSEYFTKLFKQETGYNIKEYILQTKIDAAKDILEHSDMPVSLVAMELGWSNFSHFTQVFKKFENMTPTEYKNLVMQKKD